MKITIIKALNNRDVVSKNTRNYHKFSSHTKRLWLKEKINIVDNGSVVYNLICSNGFSVEGRIYKSGTNKDGFYILFCMDPYKVNNNFYKSHKTIINNLNNLNNLKNYIQHQLEEKEIPCGKSTLTEIFNPHKDTEFSPLLDMKFFSFNGCKMKCLLKDDSLILGLTLGNLKDIGFHIELSGIKPNQVICENNDELEGSPEERISDIHFRKYGTNKYIVYINSSCSEDIHKNVKKTDFNVETICFHHQYVIECKNIHINKYNYFVNNVTSKGIKCFKLHEYKNINYINVLKKKWKKSFLKNFDINSLYANGFLWDVFLSEKLNAIEGIEAKEAFDKINCDTIYIAHYDYVAKESVCYRLENANNFNRKMLECYSDIYITDKNFTWTYVRTHEDSKYFGPFFYNKNIE